MSSFVVTSRVTKPGQRISTIPKAASAQQRAASVTNGDGRQSRIDEFVSHRNAARDFAVEAFSKKDAENNGDEELFAGRAVRGKDGELTGFASFSKGLKHDDCGIVEKRAFDSLVSAVNTGLSTTDEVATRKAFERVKLGGGRRLANPIASHSTQLIGNDSNGSRMAPAPTFGSFNTAADMVERYWMAVCRDVPFEEYATNSLTCAACEDLNNIGFSDIVGAQVTPENLFRGTYEGACTGPYLSQFLIQDIGLGNQNIEQIMQLPQEGLDYMTDMKGWLAINNGEIDPSGTDALNVWRRMSTLRDGGQWVHIDLPLQSSLFANALLTGLLGMGAELADSSPYRPGGEITTSSPFTTLGVPDYSSLAALASGYGLKHAWFQKWAVHRRLRPEVYAQRLELFRCGLIGNNDGSPFDDRDFKLIFRDGVDVWRKTKVLEVVFKHNEEQNKNDPKRENGGTWLLPMGYPEGSPTHPAYPGGHSVFAAAGATIAKAFFKDTTLPNPKMVNPKDRSGPLIPYKGPLLTVHGELNKLITNVTHLRDGMGMHWRSDGAPTTKPRDSLHTGGNVLGEEVAVSMLRDAKLTYREETGPFQFKGIRGNVIKV